MGESTPLDSRAPRAKKKAGASTRKGRIARRYRISGRVQGVGFRTYTERVARELGITGWVCNREDGSVEVHANGSPADLDNLEAFLRQGPRMSEVRAFHWEEAEVRDARGFHIR